MTLRSFTMNLRSQRLSDVVAAVCVPASITLYLLAVLTPPATQPLPFVGEEEPVTTTGIRSPVVVGVPPPLNLTGEARDDLLLVTPILRCGSTTIRNLLKLLRKDNGFNLAITPPRKSEVIHIPDDKPQHDLVTNVSAVNGATALMHSFAFINFTRHGQRRPIHVSLVRNPVDRAVSWFYHVRAPFQLVERHNRFPDAKFPTRQFLKKDLETCLKDRRDQECRYVPGRARLGHTIEFFCGHESYCPVFGSRDGLERAKAVVNKSFAVVGVLEDWDKTLAVLEHYIPKYFHGATEKFETLRGDKILLNENFYKPHVDPKAREHLARNFTIEMEFYDFLRQRLDQQYRALFTPSPTPSS